jgi:hypothetical protein
VQLLYGDIVVATQSSGRLYKVDPTTGTTFLISSGGLLRDPSHILIDGAGGIWNAERSTARVGVVRTNPTDGSQTLVAAGPLLPRPTAIAFGGSSSLVVGNSGVGVSHTLVRVDLLNGTQSLLATLSGMSGLQDVDVDAAGRIVVLDFGSIGVGGGKVVRFDPVTNQQSVVSAGGSLVNPTDLLIMPSGDFIVSNRLPNSTTQIVKINSITGAQQIAMTVPSEGFLALEGENSIVYADFNRNLSILRLNLLTGQTQTVSSFLFPNNLVGIAVYSVPEPSTYAMTVLGVFGLLPFRRLWQFSLATLHELTYFCTAATPLVIDEYHEWQHPEPAARYYARILQSRAEQ